MGGETICTYKVFWFRDGRKEVGRVECTTPEEALEWAKSQENAWLGDGLAIVETTLIMLPSPQTVRGAKQHRVSHTLAHLEAEYPNVVFVCVISLDAFMKAGNVVEEETQRPGKGVSGRSKKVRWADMPAEWRERIQRTKNDCWLWMTSEKGPFLDVYRRMKGPIPEGASFRHSCGDQRCVNPDHLNRVASSNGHDVPGNGRDWHAPMRKAEGMKRH